MDKEQMLKDITEIEKKQNELREESSKYRDKEQKYRFLKRGALTKIEALEAQKSRIKYSMN